MMTSRVPGVTGNSGWRPVETATWFDADSRWKATGQLQADGSMTGVAVADPSGTTRALDLRFTSKRDFISWLRRLTS